MCSGWTKEDEEATQDDGYGGEDDDLASEEGGLEWDCGFLSSDEVG